MGLDIQTDSVRALAALRQRNGWKICHYWQQCLPAGVLSHGNLQQPEALSDILQQWSVQLPRKISLRIAFPAQRVLQQTLPVPDQRLREPERSWFINAAAARQFPLDSQVLALDYRLDPTDNTRLRVTAARQDELQRWQRALQRANLTPHVIDIAPCALHSMAAAAGLLPQRLLVHRLADAWLWVSPLDAPFQYGLITPEQGSTVPDALQQLCLFYSSGSPGSPELRELTGIYYCSTVLDEPIPEQALAWSPFSVFKCMHLTLPSLPAAFVLAGGLALRSMDNEDG